MTKELYNLIEKWNLQAAFKRLKHPEHAQDVVFKDEEGNLPIHGLLRHPNAVDAKLDEKVNRPDRPHFFKLLDIMLDVLNGLMTKEELVDVRNNAGKVPSQLAGLHLSLKGGKEEETLERLKTLEKSSMSADVVEGALHTKTPKKHTKIPSRGGQKKSSGNRRPESESAAEPVADTKVDPSTREAPKLINCDCSFPQLDPQSDHPCTHNAGFFDINRCNDKKSMNTCLQRAMIYTRKHKKFTEALSDPTMGANGDAPSRREWEDFSQNVLKVCVCDLGPDEGCDTCNAGHPIFRKIKIPHKREAECLVQLNKAVKSVEEFNALPSVDDVRLQLTNRENELKQRLAKLEEDHEALKEALKQAEENGKNLDEALKQAEDDAKKSRKAQEQAQDDAIVLDRSLKKAKENIKRKDESLKQAQCAVKTTKEELEVEKHRVDDIKKELDACMNEKEKIKDQHDKTKILLQESDSCLDRMIRRVADLYDGSPDDKGSSLMPSELSVVLQSGLKSRDCFAQLILLEKVLERLNEDVVPLEKKQSLTRDLPLLVTTICDNSKRGHLIQVTNRLISYLKSRDFSDTRGNVKKAESMLCRMKRLPWTNDVSVLKQMCLRLASDCESSLLETLTSTSACIDADVEEDGANRNTNRQAVSPPSSMSTRRAKRRLSVTTDAVTGASNKTNRK